MLQLKQSHAIDTKDIDLSWKAIYKLGGAAALVALAGTLLDISITFIPGWGISMTPQTAIEWYALFHENWLLGLRNLDLLNVIMSIVSIPTYFALYTLHKKIIKDYAAFAMILFLVGTIIFIANNSALPMLSLSNKFDAASTEAQRSMIAAAGEAMLARGEHGSPGAFMGFALSSLSSMAMALVMLRGKIFSKAAAYIGMLGFTFLLIYTISATFGSKSNDIVMVLAMPGGLLAMAWNVIVARKLLRIGR